MRNVHTLYTVWCRYGWYVWYVNTLCICASTSPKISLICEAIRKATVVAYTYIYAASPYAHSLQYHLWFFLYVCMRIKSGYIYIIKRDMMMIYYELNITHMLTMHLRSIIVHITACSFGAVFVCLPFYCCARSGIDMKLYSNVCNSIMNPP